MGQKHIPIVYSRFPEDTKSKIPLKQMMIYFSASSWGLRARVWPQWCFFLGWTKPSWSHLASCGEPKCRKTCRCRESGHSSTITPWAATGDTTGSNLVRFLGCCCLDSGGFLSDPVKSCGIQTFWEWRRWSMAILAAGIWGVRSGHRRPECHRWQMRYKGVNLVWLLSPLPCYPLVNS